MKNKCLLLFCLLLSFNIITAQYGKPCYPDGVFFQSQSQVDNFLITNPDCIMIIGDVKIGGWDIVDLTPLNNLINFGGDLEIVWNNKLTDLTGLENVKEIFGDLILQNNTSIENLVGLNGLKRIRGDFIVKYDSIRSFKGLDSLEHIAGDFELLLNSELKRFSGLRKLDSIGGWVDIDRNKNLKDYRE